MPATVSDLTNSADGLPNLVKGFPEEYDTLLNHIAEQPNYLSKSIAQQARDINPELEGPLISILLPIYKVPLTYLKAAIESILVQSYANWQGCIVYADSPGTVNLAFLESVCAADSRFSLTLLERNQGISANSNACLRQAQGDYVALLDHDDVLARNALTHVAEAIIQEPSIDFCYSDKDCLNADGELRLNPLFKPQWSPEIMYSVNYLTHLCVIRRSLVEAVGGFRSECDGAQDWDLFLRVSELNCKIKHIASIDYHWRIHPGSSSVSLDSKPYVPEAQLLVLNQHLQRQGLAAQATPHPLSGFQIRWQVDNQAPIPVLPLAWGDPDANQAGECAGIGEDAEINEVAIHASGTGERTPGEAAERIDPGADPNANECLHTLLAGYESLLPIRHHLGTMLRSIDHDWSEHRRLELNCALLALCCQMLGQQAKSDQEAVLLFVSAQAELESVEPFSELIHWTALHPMIGFCGSLVCDRNDQILDAGVLIDDNDRPISLYYHSRLAEPTLFPSALWYRNWRAVSPLCTAIKVRAFAAVGGFPDAPDFNHSFVELCRRIHGNGLRGMSNPHSLIRLRSSTAAEWLKPTDPLGWFVNEPYFNPHLVAGLPLRFA